MDVEYAQYALASNDVPFSSGIARLCIVWFCRMTRPIHSVAPLSAAAECNLPLVPVSWGEVLDKITILEIKEVQIDSAAALFNVRKELDYLRKVVSLHLVLSNELKKRVNHLCVINSDLWKIEDDLRDFEQKKQFDDEFISLARSVYLKNDERARIKREINRITGSIIVEEKSYSGEKQAKSGTAMQHH